MKKILFICTLPFISSIVFAQCDTSNVYDSITCYEKELKLNKSQLNKTYQKLYKTLDSDGQKILENSQKSWLLYKNSHCDELVSHLSMSSLGAGCNGLMKSDSEIEI